MLIFSAPLQPLSKQMLGRTKKLRVKAGAEVGVGAGAGVGAGQREEQAGEGQGAEPGVLQEEEGVQVAGAGVKGKQQV